MINEAVLHEEEPVHWLRVTSLFTLFVLSGCIYGPVSSNRSIGIRGTNIVATVEASTNCANRGDAVTLRASVANQGSKEFNVDTRDRPILNLCIGNYPGYSKCWADGKALTPELTKLQLKPGESKTIEMKWVAEPAGSYGVGVIFVFDPNISGGQANANVTVGVAPDCPGNR